MAWSWSHSQEAYDKAHANLGKKSVKFLAECYAEWKCRDIDEAVKAINERLLMTGDASVDELPEELRTDPYTDGRYEGFVADAKNMSMENGREYLVELVWARMSSEDGGRMCGIGGYSPWACPDGCHTVEW